MTTLKDLVKDNFVEFSHYRVDNFFFNVKDFNSEFKKDADYYDNDRNSENYDKHYDLLQFPVPIEEIGNATIYNTEKAITFMRWLRAAIKNGTLVKV